MRHNGFDPASVQRNLVISLIVSAAISNSLIVFSGDEDRAFVSNWTINAVVAIALGMSILITLRQKLDGLHGKTYAAFTTGLALWFVAEMLWTYYELGQGIEEPFPSLADLFWLTGYGPLAYHLFMTFRFFGRVSKKHLFIASLGAAIFLAQITGIILGAAESTDVMALAISIAYPALDAVLIVPTIAVLASLWRGRLTFTPWVLISSAILITAIADSGFAYYTAAGMEDGIWVWDLLYNTSYIMVAATLFWHNRFFVFDEKRVKKAWQQENR
jgi:hypothetical protein